VGKKKSSPQSKSAKKRAPKNEPAAARQSKGQQLPTFQGGFGPVSVREIAAVERRLQVRFPPDYKRFLRTINGGGPDPCWFLVPNCGGAYADWLYGIRDERIQNDLEYQQSNFVDPLPAGYVVIGRDPGANLILLTVTVGDGTTPLGKGAGRVCSWIGTGSGYVSQGSIRFQ
jgi:hypothetical protein